MSPGDHQIKVVAKNQDSGTISQNFAAGSSVELNDFRSQFALLSPPPPSPIQTAEEFRWQQIKNSGSIDDLEKFSEHYPNSAHLRQAETRLEKLYWAKATSSNNVAAFSDYLGKYPDGTHRAEAEAKLEDLYWEKAKDSNTVQAFGDFLRQYPQGPQSESARKKIEELRFQAAQNSADEAVLQAFLQDYPSGDLHDQIYRRLDDVVWQKTNTDDVTGLRAYLRKFEKGHHADQAEKSIEQLTLAVNAPPSPPLALRWDDKRAVLDVVAQYRQAYEHKDIEEMKKIWPGIMTDPAVRGLRKVFRDAGSVRMTCEIIGEPFVNGDQATIRFSQSLSIDGHQQRAQLVMMLRRVDSGSSAIKKWQIDSVGK